MIGKKKYTQAELDAAVDRARRDEREAAAAIGRRDAIATLRRIIGQAPDGLLYTAAFVSPDSPSGVSHHSLDVKDLRAVFEELDHLGWRP